METNPFESPPVLGINDFIAKYRIGFTGLNQQTTRQKENPKKEFLADEKGRLRAEFDAVIGRAKNSNAICLLMQTSMQYDNWVVVDALEFTPDDWQRLSNELNFDGLQWRTEAIIATAAYLEIAKDQEAARIIARDYLDFAGSEASDNPALAKAHLTIISLALQGNPMGQLAFTSTLFEYGPDREQADRMMIKRKGNGQLSNEMLAQLRALFGEGEE